MYKQLVAAFLCFLSVLMINNPAMAINQESKIQNKLVTLDNYNISLNNFVNISQSSEPIYLVRERKSRETTEMSGAWIASIFISGLGQMLLGDVGRGVLFLLGTAVGYALFFLPGLVVHIWCVFDAYNMAKKKAEGDDEARVLEERISKLIDSFDKITTNKASIQYNLVSF